MARAFRIFAALIALIGFGLSDAHAQVPLTGAGRGAPSSTATCASVLPNLILNLDASVSASVHLSGSSVTQWDDQSGAGNNFVQATGARQPTFSATGFNASKPGVTVVAANSQFVQNATFPLNSATLSIFVVLIHTSNTQTNGGVVSFLAAGQTDDFANNPSFTLEINPGTPAYIFASNAYLDNQQASVVNTPATIGWIFDGANGAGYLNFSADTPAVRTATFGGTTGVLAFGTHPWNGNTPSLDGTYAEIIISTSALSSGQRSALHTCLTAKWGVP